MIFQLLSSQCLASFETRKRPVGMLPTWCAVCKLIVTSSIPSSLTIKLMAHLREFTAGIFSAKSKSISRFCAPIQACSQVQVEQSSA